MTKSKSDALGPSGPLVWTDGELVQQLPDLSVVLRDSCIDAQAFGAWLRAPLAQFRAHAMARASMAERAAIIRWLEAAAAAPGAARADGRLARLPAWYAEPAVSHAALKIGRTWREALAAGSDSEIGDLLKSACESLRRQKANRGRPSMRARDELLRAVVTELKKSLSSVEDAEHLADEVLVACGVPSPEASIGRAARRAKRGGISV
ncbi:hypothetical protein CDN99_11710 [Roseateles aquatilis]|uniref:Uncharacterized protein n=1 Tax=Roseateles aquatilis TaxID=431061 RepID=A0A246JE96_9BURK|nr:hypothetical protein [Roseateles aquatilis]OWQ90827.1 hypothetical protein CDN99_11710 [Roseateles aquatilis]